MGRRCRVCDSEDIEAINQRLATRPNFLAMQQEYGISEDSFRRHHDDHLPALLVRAGQLQEIAAGEVLLSEVRSSMADLDRNAAKAEAKGDHRGAGQIIKSKAPFLGVLVAAGSLLLEERRLQSAELPEVKKASLADIKAVMDKKLERELVQRLAEERSGAVIEGSRPPIEVSGVRPPGHLDPVPESPADPGLPHWPARSA